ncbi:hypothetical protein B0T16DRAFT_410060 [Cercophora newfieldiana]|uniref:Polynucleotide 5'-hydroxyl-kinase GRC3 n=1 Tax=Cercophora newfieldiana TaxID=92897 RepID=A0AA39YB80_9PEZI|nr:hypothetical protein B0T16DRAFT_410060 [Cercophora newfieldiana]
MTTPKKRKVEGGSGAETPRPVLSAFAARQKLWGMASASADVSVRSREEGPGQETQGSPLPTRNAPKSPSLLPSRASKRQVAESKPASQREEQPEGRDMSAPISPGAKTVTQHSTFRPDKQRKNYQQKPDGRVFMRLGEGERLVILGSFGIRVKEGEATISGAVLQSSSATHWVHAPHCHATPVLRISSPSVVELQPHPAARALRQLARLSPLFGKLWNETPATSTTYSDDSTFQVMFTSEDVPKRVTLQELSSPAEWNKKLAGLVKAKLKGTTPVVFLCGPKSSGKSTFGKLLANRLITDQGDSNKKAWTSVAILDIDPGQPEYGPPGVISLNKLSAPNLVPSFCHPSLDPTHGQLKAHAVASITPAQDPSHYIECTLDLLTHYRTNLGAKCPLIINTPGWIQGTGLDILSELIKEIRPTEVIYMSRDGPDETVDSLTSACGTVIPFTTLPSQTTNNTSRTSNDFRAMQTLSYFHLNWPSLSTAHPTWDPTPLTALRPWRVRYRGPSKGFTGILCYDHQPGPHLLAEAIAGMILALVQVSHPSAFRDLLPPSSSSDMDLDTDPHSPPSPATTTTEIGIIPTPEGLPLIQNPLGRTLDPRHSRALGLLLIRGIDTQRGELHVLTPLPAATLAEVGGQDLVLVAGKFDTPTWAYAEDLYLRALAKTTGAVTPAREGDGEESSEEEDEEEEVVGEIAKAEDARVIGMARDEVPWVEALHGNQKKEVGSRVWRVRRDLGRN